MSGTAGGGRREARRQGGVTDRPTSPMPPGGRYGSTQAALNVHGRDVGGPTRKEEVYPAQIRRTRQQQTQNQRDEPGLIQRAVGGIGILVLFAVGVTTASYRRTASGQLSGAAVKTTVFDRATGAASDVATLSVAATNEYGKYSEAALALYGLQMVVEPHRQTTLTTASSLEGASGAASAGSVFSWRIVELDFDAHGNTFEPRGREAVIEAEGPEDHVIVELKSPGGVYGLTVEERVTPAFAENLDGMANLAIDEAGGGGGAADGLMTVVVARATVTISCKHVRRELRQLTEEDRKDFLDAMEVYYTISTEDGKAKYGRDFFNYELLTAYHNSDLSNFCYHAGLQFLTAHAAFGLMMERSLQTINPKVALPFWDYMVEAETVGTGWLESSIFDADMFGRAMGSPDNDYQVTEGRFGGIRTIYDPEYTLLDNGIDIGYHYNAYGYLSPTYNYQDLPHMTRASSFCNLKAHAVFATSEVLFTCFSAHDNLADWELCMEKKVHGDMHGLLGGAFNCNVDMNEFHLQHPQFSEGLLTFVLEYLTSKYWPNNNFSPDYNECDTECETGQAEPCGCTCTIDALSLSDDEVYALTESFMSSGTRRYSGDKFLCQDETSDRPWGFMQDGVRLGDDETMLLLRHVVKIGCEPGAVGAMVGGTSPMDPLFWVLHPLFEKALHVLWMSPQFRDSYNFDWIDGSCVGSKIDDRVPFTQKNLGMGGGTELLTNRDMMTYLHASNPRLPYLYEDFGTWGTSKGWDFCPECTAAAVATAAAATGTPNR